MASMAIQIFAVVFVAVFSAGLLSQIVFNNIIGGRGVITANVAEIDREYIETETQDSQNEAKAENRIVVSLPRQDAEEMEVSVPESAKDLCDGVECGSTSMVCPDGFRDRCKNFCVAGTGKCTDCTPECSGHEMRPREESRELQNEASSTEEAGTRQNEEKPAQKTGVKIKEVKYKSDGDDRLKENWNGEWVVIEGSGNLGGWTLSDDASHVFTFPAGFAFSGSVKVHSGDGENTQAELYWNGGKRPVWNNDHDTARLKDNNGGLVDEYSY